MNMSKDKSLIIPKYVRGNDSHEASHTINLINASNATNLLHTPQQTAKHPHKTVIENITPPNRKKYRCITNEKTTTNPSPLNPNS